MTGNSRKLRNRLRIIGGDWRSRQVEFAEGEDIRPTPDRVRETLFNWLQFDVAGARCLDLFAGSGILGFEALSRGAASVTALELDRAAARLIMENRRALGADALELLQADALHWLAHAEARAFHIAFLDPPFRSDSYERCFELLASRGWLAPGARVYVEASTPIDAFVLPREWTVEKAKRAGEVHYGLLRSP